MDILNVIDIGIAILTFLEFDKAPVVCSDFMLVHAINYLDHMQNSLLSTCAQLQVPGVKVENMAIINTYQKEKSTSLQKSC